jgi:hypothetical protein
MKEAVRTSDTSFYFSETTRRYNPENCHLHFPHLTEFLFLLDLHKVWQEKLLTKEPTGPLNKPNLAESNVILWREKQLTVRSHA